MSDLKVIKRRLIAVPYWLWWVALGYMGYSTGHFLRDLFNYIFK